MRKILFFLVVTLIPVQAIRAEEPIKSFSGQLKILYENWVYIVNLEDETLMLVGAPENSSNARAAKSVRKSIFYGPDYLNISGGDLGNLVIGRNLPSMSGASGMYADARQKSPSHSNNTPEISLHQVRLSVQPLIMTKFTISNWCLLEMRHLKATQT